MKQIPPVIGVLLAINGIIFLPALIAPESYRTILSTLALYFPKAESFKIYQLVSYMFLHGSVAHIFFNMFALASFGIPLTMVWGWKRFILFYFATGIGAAFIYTGVNYVQFSNAYQAFIEAGFTPESMSTLLTTSMADPALIAKLPQETIDTLLGHFTSRAVGASGAIYGVLVAFGVLFPNAKLSLMFLPVPIPAKYFIPVIVLLDLFSGITGFSLFGGGIAHFAHVGGAVIGFLIMMYWKIKYPVKIQFHNN